MRTLRAAGVVVAVAALLVGCGSSSHRAAFTTRCGGVPASSPGGVAYAPHRLRVLATTSVPIDGPPLQAGSGSVWSASSVGLVRLSAAAVRPKIVVRAPINDVVLAGGCVYALSEATNRLIEFDPRVGKVTRRWALGGGGQSLAAAAGEIYVAFSGSPPAVERIDLRTGSTRRASIGPASGLASDRAIAVGPAGVWVADGGSLYRLDRTTLSLKHSVSLAASDIWFGDGSLWAASENPNGGVERLDPFSARVLARVDSDAIQIAFSPRAVWLAAAAGPTAIDPVTAKREAWLSTTNVPSNGAGGIAVVGNQVWTVYTDLSKLQRVLAGR